MTEQMAIEYGKEYLHDLTCAVCKVEDKHKDFVRLSIEALEKQSMVNEILNELKQYRAIGTVEELQALKENERKCEECAGCTAWLCDCSHERNKAIEEFAERLKERFKGMQMAELQGEDVCPYAEEDCPYMYQDVSCQYCAREQTIKDIDEIAESMKGEKE